MKKEIISLALVLALMLSLLPLTACGRSSPFRGAKSLTYRH